MKTYEINILATQLDEPMQSKHFITTDANKMDVQKCINFVQDAGDEKSIDKLLVALRVLGFKAREVKVTAEEVFDL